MRSRDVLRDRTVPPYGQAGGALVQAPPSCGRIAQLVEQLTLNQRVPGSSPGAPTILLRYENFFEVDRAVLQPSYSLRSGFFRLELLNRAVRESGLVPQDSVDRES
jgi:hypothetical protein